MTRGWIAIGVMSYVLTLLSLGIFVDLILLTLDGGGKGGRAFIMLCTALATLLVCILVAKVVFDVREWKRIRKVRRDNEEEAIQNIGAAQEGERAPGELARSAEGKPASVVYAAEERPFLTHEGELWDDRFDARPESVQARDAEAEERLRAWLRANRTLGW